MSAGERTLYLLVILVLIISNSVMSFTFTEHYNLLLKDLSAIEKMCKKSGLAPVKKQCPL